MFAKQYTDRVRQGSELLVIETSKGLVKPALRDVEALAKLSDYYGINGKFLLPGGGVSGYSLALAGVATVWPRTGRVVFPSVTTTMYAVSTSASDDYAAGTGARRVSLRYSQGTGLSLNVQSVDLTGTTPVAFPSNVYRIFETFIIVRGSPGVNVGDIKIQNAAGTEIYDFIKAGDGATNVARFTVPKNHRFVCFGIAGSNGGLTTSFVDCFSTMNPSTGVPDGIMRTMFRLAFGVGGARRLFREPVVFPEGTDIELVAATGIAMDISACLLGRLEKLA